MTKIFVTHDIPNSGIELLKKNKVEIDIFKSSKRISKKELIKRASGCDILVSMLTEKIDSKTMDAIGDNLKMIANYAVGFDNINIQEAKKRGIIVTNTPCDTVNESVAEHAIALMFGLAHRIVEADDFTRAGKYTGWNPTLLLGTNLKNKTVGIVGTGCIGMAIARRLFDGFGIRILYHDIKRNTEIEKKYKAKMCSLTELLKKSDFITLHVPLNKATHHLIGAQEISKMQKSAYIINTARGAVIDEVALTRALARGDIAGAGLDVYECEPLIDCNPKDKYELRKLKNVILTPHTASATIEAREEMSEIVAKNIIAFLNGKKIPNKLIF
ncbi:D-glycerate dehydrogenase [Patescibacteria group bacterium]|nr:D-glycerate dehydrogenase [Patescibacteria group bacterium]